MYSIFIHYSTVWSVRFFHFPELFIQFLNFFCTATILLWNGRKYLVNIDIAMMKIELEDCQTSSYGKFVDDAGIFSLICIKIEKSVNSKLVRFEVRTSVDRTSVSSWASTPHSFNFRFVWEKPTSKAVQSSNSSAIL